MGLMPLRAAQETICAALKSEAAVEEVSLAEALGRVLARDVVAKHDQPPFRASAMDGYAVRAADTPGRLRVVGESVAGRGFAGRVEAGQAVRIFTGAPVPAGADAIAIQEDVRREGDLLDTPATPRQHVREAGRDYKSGAVLIHAGERLDPFHVALAASAGFAALPVLKRPRLALMTVGDELAAPGAALGLDMIYDALGEALSALVHAWGAEVVLAVRLRDDPQAIAAFYAQALALQPSLIVAVGGASVGDHDHSRAALAAAAPRVLVKKVAVRPGKPTWFAQTAQAPILGLPGNPASALVCAHLFLRPALETLQGRESLACVETTPARLIAPVLANGPRAHFLRARLGVDSNGVRTVAPLEDQDSSLLSVFAQANALVHLAPHAAALEPGALVQVLPLDRAR
jgi:molybdopterin molybdotransferase